MNILQQISEATISLAQKVKPSVVTLQISLTSGQQGVASGFFIQPNLILSNAHPFQVNPDSLTVVLSNGEAFEGELLGKDLASDVSIIEVKANGLGVDIGDSDKVRVGEFVMAVGSPLAFTQTVTTGIISATGRRLQSINNKPLTDIIQTDAAINEGSSGGPLFNYNGEVIGINTAIIKLSQNICFAIPINKAMRIAKILSEYGELRRPTLGMKIEDRDKNIVIYNIFRNSLAEKYGLQEDDIIKVCNGTKITNTDSFFNVLSELDTDILELQIQRGRKKEKIEINLGV